ncbi:hypothetical protein [Desulfopila aestuarii]|uniref:DUF5648 domain-containing protein n=1 Tax=Desulfopila aestuarii DSM 18488 TaxID=1121416 RepID=A0A1M7YFH2_9BACT|nr:hypothetical protein [Desulfopila aestuarii]SHO51397.1 hypothetical protein SAMN02745220_03984 [Desulfopila aestuarii DSM 18488]
MKGPQMLLLIISLFFILYGDAEAKIVTETVYGTLSEKSENVGEGYEVGRRYELFTVTYDDSSTVMHVYNTDGSLESTRDSIHYNFDIGADAEYVLAPFLVNFLDTYCVTPNGTTTYYNWYYSGVAIGGDIYQRADEYSYLELQKYTDESRNDYGYIVGSVGSVTSFIRFDKVERVRLVSPIVEATINDLDCFQIEGDPRIWLDLDNPNILGKSYNEIKAWAKDNGFRFATEKDVNDLVLAVLPLGNVEYFWFPGVSAIPVDSSSAEAYYTYAEIEAIGVTSWYKQSFSTTGYTLTNPYMPINVTRLYSCLGPTFCGAASSSSANEIYDDISYVSGDVQITGRSAWLIYDNSRVPIYQFYSQVGESHYFTADEADKDKIFANWLDYWKYIGIGWYGYANPQPGTIPIYHFYAPSTESHYFTKNEEEKNYIISTWPQHWQYIGVAWYGNSTQEPGTKPIYQFYSYAGDSHYFTASEAEKNYIMITWPDYWTYIGVGWYGYEN